MKAYAYLKYARISPRKVKIVLDLIRGKDAGAAMAILKNTNKGASEYLIKLLGSSCEECLLLQPGQSSCKRVCRDR